MLVIAMIIPRVWIVFFYFIINLFRMCNLGTDNHLTMMNDNEFELIQFSFH